MGRSRRSAAPATGSRIDPFRTARRRLTLLYVATIAVVVAVLSSALYEFHARDVEGIERRSAGTEAEGPLPATEERRPSEVLRVGLEEYLEHLGRSILVADVITVLIGGVLSYLLAGYFISLTTGRLPGTRWGVHDACEQDTRRNRRTVAVRRPVRGAVDRTGDDQGCGRGDCSSALHYVRGNSGIDDGQCARAVSNQRLTAAWSFTEIEELIVREICVVSGYNTVAMPIYGSGAREMPPDDQRMTMRVVEKVDAVCAHCGGKKMRRLMSRFAMPRSEESRMESLANPSKMGDVNEGSIPRASRG